MKINKILIFLVIVVALVGAVFLVQQNQNQQRRATVTANTLYFDQTSVSKNNGQEITAGVFASVLNDKKVDSAKVKMCYDASHLTYKSESILATATNRFELLGTPVVSNGCVVFEVIAKNSTEGDLKSGEAIQLANVTFTVTTASVVSGQITFDLNDSYASGPGADPTQLKVVFTVGTPLVYSLNGGTVNPLPNCSPENAKQCSSTTNLQTCTNGSWVDTNCPNGCENGACSATPATCIANEWYCDGTSQKKKCDSSGSGYLASETCVNCTKNTTTKIVSCPSCTNNSQCQSGQVCSLGTCTCNPTSCNAINKNCDLETGLCIDKPATCIANEWYCDGTTQKKQCNSSGSGYLASETCVNCTKNTTTKIVSCPSCTNNSQCQSGQVCSLGTCTCNPTSCNAINKNCDLETGLCIDKPATTVYKRTSTTCLTTGKYSCSVAESGFAGTTYATQTLCEGTCTYTPPEVTSDTLRYRISFVGVRPPNGIDPICRSNWSTTFIVDNKSVTSVPVEDVGSSRAVTIGGYPLIVSTFTGSVNITGLTTRTGLSVFTRGPKHLQIKYGVNGQTSMFNQANGQITLGTDTFYDFSGYPMLAGDVNNDGLINGQDYTLIKAAWSNTGNNLAADLDGNCLVNAGDTTIYKLSLVEKQGQLY